MDGRTFDRMTRLFAGAMTRRGGLAAALAGLAAGSAGLAEAKQRGTVTRAAEPREDDLDDEAIDPEGPCGKGRKNRCTKHSDCCTRFCKKIPGKGKRCRCIKKGRKCKKGQRCCKGLRCQAGRCGPKTPPAPPEPACGATGAACTADASCCDGLICERGLCAPCVEKVCASGCDYDNVNTAYAEAASGDTIYIGPGTYPTGIVVSKDIILAACPGVADVILEPDRLVIEGNDDNYAVMTSGPDGTFSVTLRNLTLKGSATGIAEEDETLLSNFGGTVNWTVENCTMSHAYKAISSVGGDITISNSTMIRNWYITSHYYQDRAASVTITDSVIKENLDGYLMDFYYGDTYDITVDVQRTTFEANESYIYADAWNKQEDPAQRARSTVSFTDCTITNQQTQFLYGIGGIITFTDCTITGSGETPIEVSDCSLTLNNTIVSGNTGDYYGFYGFTAGGGIRISADAFDTSLTLGPGSKITDNTAQYGAGLLTDEYQATLTVTGVNSTTVFGNNGPNCSDYSPPNPPEVPNCAYP